MGSVLPMGILLYPNEITLKTFKIFNFLNVNAQRWDGNECATGLNRGRLTATSHVVAAYTRLDQSLLKSTKKF